MFAPQLSELKTILCLGSHSDDIEIGCGGTILKLIREHANAEIHWVVFSSAGERADEARTSATHFLAGASRHHIEIRDFRDRYFPQQSEEIKEFIHSLASRIQPDLIFTHRLEDRHQDHRLVAEFTWNAFRNNLIFEYEIPKYEGDLGHPNVFVPLEKELCDSKIHTTYDCFRSQQDKSWFTLDTFAALLRLRGLECNSASGFAEAFHCRKMTLSSH